MPDRIVEGYGPNTPALLKLMDQGVSLVITVDCGTTAFAPLKEAADAGLDVVVIDHHVSEPTLPEAVAVVNPNRLDETSPVGQLCAAGMAFMLIIAIDGPAGAGKSTITKIFAKNFYMGIRFYYRIYFSINKVN